ncbi:MAG: DUF1800 domain-containing protein [Pyrinomonadaceae bacterium]
MDRNTMRPHVHAFFAIIVALLLFSAAFPQEDPNPNSPTPILLTIKGSTSALAIAESRSRGVDLGRIEEKAFLPDQNVVLFVANLALAEGEGANALRVYAENKQGRHYRFPVLNLQPVKNGELYALTIKLRDEIGLWEKPRPNGHLTMMVTWRGLASNRVSLSLGKISGRSKNAPESAAYPNSSNLVKQPHDEALTVGYLWAGDRIRFLEQAAFGPTTALDQRIRRIGLRTWLAEQFGAPYPTFDNPYPNLPLKNGNAENVDTGCGAFLPRETPEWRICVRDHYSQFQFQNWFFKEALYGDAQLRHRVSWALSQLWVVSGVDTQQARWMIEYHKILSDHAFGNYFDLMKEITKNPAMGNYLDMVRSTRRNPNENYPREILQLFTIGLFELEQDGTTKLDQNSQPIPTYDQADVDNFTKVFTGWTLCENTASCPNRAVGAPNYIDPMLLNQANHDVSAKSLLNYPGAVHTDIPADLDGETELDRALQNIFNHPNVAPFVSKILIQHLVTSDPTPAYVGRISAIFRNNGSGVRGDLKAVVRAILLDPEARGDLKTDPNYGKLREPVQFFTNIGRQFNIGSADGSGRSDGVVNSLVAPLGQNVFNPATVFNYYPPDFVVPGEGLLAPEFSLMTTGASIGRANLANTLVYSRLNVNLPDRPFGTSIDLSELQAIAAADTTGEQLIFTLNTRLMHSSMSAGMKSAILATVTDIPPSNPLARAQQAVYLITSSSQYQVQR